jgi:hypothetical protein
MMKDQGPVAAERDRRRDRARELGPRPSPCTAKALPARELAQAPHAMMAHPLALELRNLQTRVELPVNKNSTIVFPAH